MSFLRNYSGDDDLDRVQGNFEIFFDNIRNAFRRLDTVFKSLQARRARAETSRQVELNFINYDNQLNQLRSNFNQILRRLNSSDIKSTVSNAKEAIADLQEFVNAEEENGDITPESIDLFLGLNYKALVRFMREVYYRKKVGDLFYQESNMEYSDNIIDVGEEEEGILIFRGSQDYYRGNPPDRPEPLEVDDSLGIRTKSQILNALVEIRPLFKRTFMRPLRFLENVWLDLLGGENKPVEISDIIKPGIYSAITMDFDVRYIIKRVSGEESSNVEDNQQLKNINLNGGDINFFTLDGNPIRRDVRSVRSFETNFYIRINGNLIPMIFFSSGGAFNGRGFVNLAPLDTPPIILGRNTMEIILDGSVIYRDSFTAVRWPVGNNVIGANIEFGYGEIREGNSGLFSVAYSDAFHVDFKSPGGIRTLLDNGDIVGRRITGFGYDESAVVEVRLKKLTGIVAPTKLVKRS